MARITTIEKKEDLKAEDQKIFDAIAQSRGAVGGPWRALLHSPEMAYRTMHLGSYVRFESSLDHKVIEFAALVSARELDCKHEWAAHVNHAQQAGIALDTIRAVYRKQGVETFSSEDAAARQFCPRDDSRSSSERADFSGDPRPVRRQRHGRVVRDHRLLRHARLHAQHFRRLHRHAARRFEDLSGCPPRVSSLSKIGSIICGDSGGSRAAGAWQKQR